MQLGGTLLWLDDLRNPKDDKYKNILDIFGDCEIVWMKTYNDAIEFVNTTWPDIICFDHDLGEEKSGYDFAKYIINQVIFYNKPVPKYYIQSSNPAGRINIEGIFKSAQKFLST